VDTSICIGLAAIPQNVQGVEGGGVVVVGAVSITMFLQRKKPLITTKHCSEGREGQLFADVRVLRGFWNLSPGKSKK
jgi:hypothetical protein